MTACAFSATLREMHPRHFLLAALALATSHGADQPQWGQAWTRNLVSSETGLATDFDPATGRNLRWIAPLGTQSYASPIVAGGRVYLGTNNENPRDPRHTGDFGVLLCLDEKVGHLLWQLLAPKRTEDQYFDWPKTGMSSPPTVEGDHVFFVDNRGAVVCLDALGLANGNGGPFQDEAAYLTPRPAPPPDFKQAPPAPGEPVAELSATDADILWMFDLPSGAGTWPHDAAHSSILIHGDFLYLNSCTGVDNTHRLIRTPDAPSLVVIEKSTGRYVARDDAHIAPNIFHCTWSSPALASVGGRELIFFAGGDGIVRAFEPLAKSPPAGEVAKLKQVWQYDIDPTGPKTDVHRFIGNKRESPSNIYGMPVFSGDRLYVAGGGDLSWGKNEAWLKCIDPAGTGDITGTGGVWSAPLDRHTMSTPAIVDGLVFIADTGRNVRCLDAATGAEFWSQPCRGEFWASPLVADGKVFIGTRKGDFWVFAASREKQVLATLELKQAINATVTAANGTLYVATTRQLFAVQQGAQLEVPASQPAP